jgi:hypothetical protein
VLEKDGEDSWSDLVRNGVLHRVKVIKIRKANWIGRILRRNCDMKSVIE